MTNIEPPQHAGPLKPEQAMQQAVAHHRSGRLQDAERLYRAILQAQPAHPDANHNLGVLAVQTRQVMASLPFFKAALEAVPSNRQYWLSYIDALIKAGLADDARKILEQARKMGLSGEGVQALAAKLEAPPGEEPSRQQVTALANLVAAKRYAEAATNAEAITMRFPQSGLGWKMLGTIYSEISRKADALASMKKAAALSPNDLEAHYNLGIFAQDSGELENAAASYNRALEIKSDFAEAHYNLGVVYRDLGQLENAAASYRLAVKIKPNYVDAHSNLGVVLQNLGQLDDAVESYRRTLKIKPNFAKAHCNLGVALHGLGQIDVAMASLRRALSFKPDYAEAHNNLGNIYKDIGKVDSAVESYRMALKINPDYCEAHNNLGVALHQLGDLTDALACYRQALKIKPGFAEGYCNLGDTLKDLGHFDDAISCYRQALEIKPDFFDACSRLLLVKNYALDQPATELMNTALRYGELVVLRARGNGNGNSTRPWTNTLDADRCLRVGLVSGDFRIHPVGYFIENVLAALAAGASARMEVVAYSTHSSTDALTEKIKGSCHGWRSTIGMSDEALAECIHNDGIDILIDLSGHTGHNRLPVFAWKPAPIQASWLGYVATSGMAAMDYYIADRYAVPEWQEAQFVEKVWRLPESMNCFTPPAFNHPVSPTPALANGYITFGSFNNLTKMNDRVVALWASVLANIPHSKLLLNTKQLSDAATREATWQRFADAGIGRERVLLEYITPRANSVAAYSRVDIALDPFPYNGGTTTAEALWMGVPVLTLAGERLAGRMGVSQLSNVGLQNWIAESAADYVAKAAQLCDVQALATLRAGLRQQALESPLFDAPRFAGHFAQALRGMWLRWLDERAVEY